MSSSVQHKLLSLEVTPPAGTWEKIIEALDESDLEHKYPAVLHNITAPPPAGTWEKIAAALNKTTLPANRVADKLLALEVTPPLTAWNKIQTALDAQHEAAIPEHRRLSPFIRYAAAAVLTGLLAWGGIRFFSNKQDNNGMAQNEGTTPPVNTISPEKNTISDTGVTNTTTENNIPLAAVQADEIRNDAALEASKKTFAKLDISTHSKIKQAANFYFGEVISNGTTRSIDINGENPENITEPVKEANRYIMLMTPEGNIIRMSKRLSGLICCVSGEEQDKECKDQMKRWREKIACSPSAHSPGNFMDILNLANSLQEENEL